MSEMVKLPKKIIKTNSGFSTLDKIGEALKDEVFSVMCTSTENYFYFDYYDRSTNLLAIAAVDKSDYKHVVVYIYKDKLIEPIEKALSEGIVESKRLR